MKNMRYIFASLSVSSIATVSVVCLSYYVIMGFPHRTRSAAWSFEIKGEFPKFCTCYMSSVCEWVCTVHWVDTCKIFAFVFGKISRF